MSPLTRGGRALAVLAALAAATLLPAAPAAASAPFPEIDASGFQLVQGSTFSEYTGWVGDVESAHPAIGPKTLADVLASHNDTARPLCHATNLAASLNPQGFCWQSGPDDTDNTWIPQGVTGSGDASSTGTVGGKRVVAVDWHYGTPPGGTDADADHFTRVSFVDITNTSSMVYRHVLLVVPSATGYTAVASHGDGLAWYGHYLYLVNSTVIRVFDLNHFWQMNNTSSANVGINSDGTFSARYHGWALPMVGSYWYQGGGCAVKTGDKPCFSSLSVDHSDNSLISVEYVAGASGGRVVRWPLDPSTGLLATDASLNVHATQAFSSPVWAMQGAAANAGHFVIAGTCAEFAGQSGDHPSCLHVGVGGQSTSELTEAPVNTENLAYWPATGELWLANEQLSQRVVVHMPWTAVVG